MFEKKVFISHSAKNKEIADHLCTFISQLGVKNSNVFCSSVIGQGIENGKQLNNAIAAAIEKSSLLIFLLSYDFLNSSYCMEELGVGWYLSQLQVASCYYLILPDIEMSDLVGFVNSKIDKFTFLDATHSEELSSLSCDISSKLHLRMKSHAAFTNAERVFLSSITLSIEQLIEAKKTRKDTLDFIEKEKNILKENLSKANDTIESLKNSLLQGKLRSKEQDANIELQTIAKVLRSLSYTQYVPKEPPKSLEKEFWFKWIERYGILLETLNQVPSDERVEHAIALIYLAVGNSSKAYEHFLHFIKLNGRYVSDYDIDDFSSRYSESLLEVIEILKGHLSLEREGMYKDDLMEIVKSLEEREASLKK